MAGIPPTTLKGLGRSTAPSIYDVGVSCPQTMKNKKKAETGFSHMSLGWDNYNKALGGFSLDATECAAVINLIKADSGFAEICATSPNAQLSYCAKLVMGEKKQPLGEQIDPSPLLPIESQFIGFQEEPVYKFRAAKSGDLGMSVKRKGQSMASWGDGVKTFKPNINLDTIGVSEGDGSSLTPSDTEDFDDLRASLKILRLNEPTMVLAVVIDKEQDENNQPSAVRCYQGIPFGGYVHDLPRDSYLVRCVEILQLGYIQVAFQITMDNIGEWSVKVPIPEKILDKHFSPGQRRMLADYRDKYKTPRFAINFIQMLGCQN